MFRSPRNFQPTAPLLPFREEAWRCRPMGPMRRWPSIALMPSLDRSMVVVAFFFNKGRPFGNGLQSKKMRPRRRAFLNPGSTGPEGSPFRLLRKSRTFFRRNSKEADLIPLRSSSLTTRTLCSASRSRRNSDLPWKRFLSLSVSHLSWTRRR